MKKIGLWITLLLMLAIIAGCGGKAPDPKDNESNEAEIKTEAAKETDKEEAEAKEIVTKEAEEKTEDEKAEEQSEEKEEKSGGLLDKTLTGAALLKQFAYNPPKTFKMVSELSGPNFSSSSVTYQDGDFTRTETTSEDGSVQVVIYNAKEGATYQYTEGESEGVLLMDGEDENSMDMSVAAPSFSDIYEEGNESIEASVEMLDGHEVIFIKTTESDPDYGDMEILMWYSVEYSVPMKYEMYMAGQLMSGQVVKEIDTKAKISPAMFEAPEDVEFMVVDLNSLFDF